MLSHFDWFSFTLISPVGKGTTEPTRLMQCVLALNAFLGDALYNPIFSGLRPQLRGGRKPYSVSYVDDVNGIGIYFHPRLDHFLVEVSGRGCAYLDSLNVSTPFLTAIAGRITRIDIANDILCDTDPRFFVADRSKGRFSAHSEVVSESGITCYVGSKTSNRYSRVYRYSDPHPRAPFLRVEFVVRAEDAKATALAVLEYGLNAVVTSLGEAFGWNHYTWNPGTPPAAELSVWRPERREGKTVYWLHETIAPLVARLHREGIIDANAWFADEILPRIQQ
jgi:hypothetical protein